MGKHIYIDLMSALAIPLEIFFFMQRIIGYITETTRLCLMDPELAIPDLEFSNRFL